MQRIKQIMAALAIAVTLAPTFAFAKENRAVKVSIFGMGPAVDADAYKRVRQVFGEGVANGSLDKLVVYGYGIEGGFSSCVELGTFAETSELGRIVEALNGIKPDPKTTSYSVEAVESCPAAN